MNNFKRMILLAVLALLLVMAPAAALAEECTEPVEGTVTAEECAEPVEGTVTVENTSVSTSAWFSNDFVCNGHGGYIFIIGMLVLVIIGLTIAIIFLAARNNR